MDGASLTPPAPDGGGTDAGGDPGWQPQCSQDLDCGPSLRCQAGVCVAREPDGGSIDAGPPEDEHFQFQPPVASEHYVFVVNTTAGSVAKIDPGQLDHISVDSIDVCAEPTTLDSTWILPRTWIDNPAAEVVEAREVLVTPDARRLVVRSYQAAELTVVDLDQGRSARVLLHGIPTDVDLAPDGCRVLVVERSVGVIALVDLVADLGRTVEIDGIRYFDPDGDGVPSADEFRHTQAVDTDGTPLQVGQAELFVTAADRLEALLYTNVDRREEVSVLDVEQMQIENLGRLINKLVAYVALAPGGRVALIVHRPDPGSPETDPVEREIDALCGYTLLDLPTRATFQQVTAAPVGPLAFSSTGQHAFLTLFDRGAGINELHVLDLTRLTLRMDFVPLEAEPRTVGVLPGGRIAYVSQQHPYGKVTFVDMVSLDKRAVTGFELNSD